MSYRIALAVLFVSFVFVVAGCSEDTPLPQDVTITLGEIISEPKQVELERYLQNNCGGTSETDYEVGRSRVIVRELELGTSFEVNAKGEVSILGTGVALGAAVSGQVGSTYGTHDSLERVVTVRAAPGTKMEHEISHQEIWKIGTATVVVNGQRTEIPYRYRHEFTLVLLDSHQLPCESTPTPIPSPIATYTPSPMLTETTVPPDLASIDMPSVLANITTGEGGIEKAAPWWRALYSDGADGIHDPSRPPGYPGCFGVAWNVTNADRTVIVFQQPQLLSFAPGGWYAQVCIDKTIAISPAQVGAIQADWLQKEHGGLWTVRVIVEMSSNCGDPQNSLGASFTPPSIFLSANLNEMRIYSHCPQSGSIQYEQIAVDDELAKVLKVCGATTEDVTWQFEPYLINGDVLQQYRSKPITLETGCRIDFYVRDLYGDNLGLHIRKAGSP